MTGTVNSNHIVRITNIDIIVEELDAITVANTTTNNIDVGSIEELGVRIVMSMVIKDVYATYIRMNRQ